MDCRCAPELVLILRVIGPYFDREAKASGITLVLIVQEQIWYLRDVFRGQMHQLFSTDAVSDKSDHGTFIAM